MRAIHNLNRMFALGSVASAVLLVMTGGPIPAGEEPNSPRDGDKTAVEMDEQAPTLQQVVDSFRRNESLINDIKGSFRLTARNSRLADETIHSKVSSFMRSGRQALLQKESKLSDMERQMLQSDLATLSQADTGYVTSYSFQWAARGDERWFRRDLGTADGVARSEEIVFDGRRTYWNQIGTGGATVWDGWISDRWPLPDDCGIAVNAVPMSTFLTRNSERCTRPVAGEYKGRRVYVFEVQGLPEAPRPKDWTRKPSMTKDQLKLRLWLDPDNQLMPVKIELGQIVHLPVGSKHESFPHYVIEPLELLATTNGAWIAKKIRLTQLAAWPWTFIQGDRDQVLTETVLESDDLVINQGLSDKLFQIRLSANTILTDMSTGESLPHSGFLPQTDDKSNAVGRIGATIEATKQRDTFLYVTTDPAGAEVLVDGKLIGKTPGLFPFDPGIRRQVTVELDSHDQHTESITIRNGTIKRLKLKLIRLPFKHQTAVPVGRTDTDPRIPDGVKPPGLELDRR